MRFRRTLMPRRRRKSRFEWIHGSFVAATPNATLNNFDLLSGFKTTLGIQVNLPELVVWRIHLRISAVITIAGAMAANDGVLHTVFVDSQNQTVLNQLSDPYDQHYLMFDFAYLTETAYQSDIHAAGTYAIARNYDIRSHRRLASLTDTLWLQTAASGQATFTSISYVQSVLVKIGR